MLQMMQNGGEINEVQTAASSRSRTGLAWGFHRGIVPMHTVPRKEVNLDAQDDVDGDGITEGEMAASSARTSHARSQRNCPNWTTRQWMKRELTSPDASDDAEWWRDKWGTDGSIIQSKNWPRLRFPPRNCTPYIPRPSRGKQTQVNHQGQW